MSASNFEPPPPNLVHRPSTFTAKFRRRRKEEASISTFTLFIFVITTTTLITPSHCLPFISSSQDDHHGTGAGGIGGIGGGGDCEMVSCFGSGSGGGGEQPNLISMSCPALKALHQCLKTLKCNGNLQYHTFQWMVRNSKRRCRSGGSGNGNGGNGRGDHPKPDQSHHSPPHHHHHHSSRSNRKQSRTSSPSPSPSSSSSTPSLLRSGDASFASFQQQLITNGKGQGRHSPHPLSVLSPVPATSQHSQTYSSSSSSSSSSLSSPSSSTSSSISPPWKTVSEQYCLSAAYNFTIGEPVLDSAHFAAVASRSSAVAVANPEEHQQQSLLLLQQQVIRGAHLRMAAKEEKEEEESSLGKRRRRLQRRDTSAKSGESARIDAEMRKRLGDAFKDYFRGQSQQQQHSNSQSKPSSSSSSESFIQDHLPQQQQSTAAAAARAYRDISGSSGSNIQQQQQQPISPPLSGSSLSELHYKPVAPMTPSLTCMIFGDPHLRTFDSRYQTCSLLGARSLIEHPLFDVQITNTRLQDQFNATGVTKVIVQVRNFAPCAIATDLLYETDSLTQDLPSSTFTDGSREHPTSAGLIHISTSSESLGLVVTIHLDHLGVRIYVSQFTHTKFINVVIKFRTATSAAVKQKLVLEAISPISLCKAGCGQRELVDVEGTLKAAGIETKGSGGKGAKGPVPQRVDDADGYDEDSGDKSVNEDEDEDEEEEEEVFTGKVTGTVAEDEEAEEDDEDDDEYYDDPSSSKDEEGDYSEQLMPQKDPRAKRVKKETVAEAESNEGRKRNKNRRREGRRNRNKNQKKTKADDSKRYLESSPSALLPPVPLHLLHLQPPPPPPQLSSVISSSSSEAQSLSPSSGELPPPPFPNSNSKPYQSKPPSLTEECHEMMPFYRLACLYDTVLKGIVSNYPHKFALSFDEPRLPAEFYSFSGTGSGSSGGDAGGSSATSRSSSPSAVGGSGSSPSSAVPVTGTGVVITPILLGVITTLLLTQL